MAEVDVAALKEAIFGNGTPQVQPTATPEPTPTAAIVEPTTTQNQPEPTTVDKKQEEEIFDVNVYLKNTFGFDSEGVAKTELENLRKLKDAPPEQSFTNEQTKKIYTYAKEGKEDELSEYFSAKRLLKEVDDKSDDDKLKLWIKMQNPLFSDRHAQDEFSETYSINEDDIDPLKLERVQLKMAQKKTDDLVKANQYFESFKQKLELPDIAPKPTAAPDAAYEQWKSNSANADVEYVKLENAIGKVSDSEVAFNFDFNDEASKMKFGVEFKADKEGVDKAKEAALSYLNYVNDKYWSKEGNPIADKFVKSIYLEENFDKIVTSAMVQAINETKKWFLANQKNIGEIQKNYATVVPDEVQRLREQIFGKTG